MVGPRPIAAAKGCSRIEWTTDTGITGAHIALDEADRLTRFAI
jgi:hypothetical protein